MKTFKPLINQLVKMIQEGYDLGKQEIPKIGSELLTYSFWNSIVYITVEILGTVGLAAAGAYFAVQANLPGADNALYWIPAIFMVFMAMALASCALKSLNTILKIKMAPRVFLLETLRDYL